MQHDPARVADTRAWLVRAHRDLRAAEHDFGAIPPLLDAVVFHCQQAAEKSFKAFLTWHDQPFRRTHGLEEVGEQCLQIDRTLQPIVDRAAPLTDYAWQFRYPGGEEEPPSEEAEEALGSAREVFDAILARLPREVAP